MDPPVKPEDDNGGQGVGVREQLCHYE